MIWLPARPVCEILGIGILTMKERPMPNTFADTILKRFLRYAVIDTMSDDKKVGEKTPLH